MLVTFVKSSIKGLALKLKNERLNLWPCTKKNWVWFCKVWVYELFYFVRTVENMHSVEASWKFAWLTEDFSLWRLKWCKAHATLHEVNTGSYFLLCFDRFLECEGCDFFVPNVKRLFVCPWTDMKGQNLDLSTTARTAKDLLKYDWYLLQGKRY